MSVPQLDPAAGASRQRHVLTVLFSDLVGSTLLGRQIDAEVMADWLDDLRRIWRASAERHSGMILRMQGDGALIVFGYPQPCEDGGRRAAETALDIHEAVEKLRPLLGPANHPPQMRSGIAAGVALVSAGDIERGRLDLVGDVANSAAGLLKSAPAGAIVAYESALGPHANFFEHVTGPEARTLLLLARKVVQRRLDATSTRGLTPLIDRDGALQRLHTFLNHKISPTNRCLLLEADAGMGKTRLVDEAILRTHELVLYGTCESYLVAEVLQPFAQMLRKHKPPIAVGSVDNFPLSPERLLEIFKAWSALQPLSIVVDDWQWADDASRQLVQGLLLYAPQVAVLLACRPREDGAHWIVDAEREVLKPLSLEGTALAVRRWLPEVDPFLLERIHSHTGGVPLYVEELCHSSSAAWLSRSLEGPGGTPSWLAAWVVGRLKHLPKRLADLVRAAAVAGNAVPATMLEDVCKVAIDEITVRNLADSDILFPAVAEQKFRFKHGLTREAVYESISLGERRALHAEFRRLLDAEAADSRRGDQVEALAYHCRGAGQWLDSAVYAERAGDRASTAFALDSARKWYLSAMDVRADRTLTHPAD